MNILPTINSIVVTTTPLDELQAFNLHDTHKYQLVGNRRVMLNRYTIFIDANTTRAQVETVLEPLTRSPGQSSVYYNTVVTPEWISCINEIINLNVAQYNQTIASINRSYD